MTIETKKIKEPLSRVEPEVLPEVQGCYGCGNVAYVAELVMGGFGATILGLDDAEASFDLCLCARCLRSLADRVDAFEREDSKAETVSTEKKKES